jgi:hypothetical protein
MLKKCCASDIVVFKINFSSLLLFFKFVKASNQGIHAVSFVGVFFYAVVKRIIRRKRYMLRTATRNKSQFINYKKILL